MIDFTSNQTQFAQEEPLLESSEPVQNLTQPKTAHQQLSRTKILLIATGVTLIIFLIIALLLAMKKPQPLGQLQPSPTPKAEAKKLTPLDKAFEELEQDLKKADPASHVLPFPPIDTDIRITK